MSILELTPSQLRQAADLKEKIEQLQKQLAQLPATKTAPVAAAKPAKRKMSAAAIAKIRAAQKARWAKIKGAAKPAAKTAPAKAPKKGGMSAAGKARIIAAQKARWAKIKAAKVQPAAAPASAAKAAPAKAVKATRKPMSAAAKAKIAAAAKARWAKVRAEKAAKK